MARCAIIGFDGIDVDVLSNLYVFYRHLGYEVALADERTPSDLLVVTRGTPRRSVAPAWPGPPALRRSAQRLRIEDPWLSAS